MRKLSDTLARLSALRSVHHQAAAPGIVDRLADLTGFGTNPGALRARTYVPPQLPRHAPLVVVLHGCTQSAAAYDHGSGWSTLADAHGFALLFPEQTRSNNANLCFNWFEPADTGRGSGEALSIRQMIARMVADHGIDEERIFITGLSAGGAMTSVMLATYPEVFAGGAIIAGLPYDVAATVPEALDRMRGHGSPSGPELAQRVLDASDHAGPWPTVSVWHGNADQTVSVSNADAILEQWRGVHGLQAHSSETSLIDGHMRRRWGDRLELYLISGMGHGTPLQTRGGDGLGHAGPFMLDQGISSTRHIARSWSIVAASDTAVASANDDRPLEASEFVHSTEMPPAAERFEPRPQRPATPPGAGADPIRSVIETALRQAGLMK